MEAKQVIRRDIIFCCVATEMPCLTGERLIN
jgi:hypothetical protein